MAECPFWLGVKPYLSVQLPTVLAGFGHLDISDASKK